MQWGFHFMQINKIITHPGIFHADEVCAIAYLQHLNVINSQTVILRKVPTVEELNDPTILVLDIGGQYQPELNNYDHHQRGGAGYRAINNIPYATFGLIVKHFSDINDKVIAAFDEQFVRYIDAKDNGDKVNNDDFNSIIACLNMNNSDANFNKAVDISLHVIRGKLYHIRATIEAEDVVLAAKVTNKHTLILDKYVPWNAAIYKRPDINDLLYVIHPSLRNNEFMIQQIPIQLGSRTGKKPFPEKWAGLSGDEFRRVSNVSGAIFCHANRFCAAAADLDSAIQLANLSASL